MRESDRIIVAFSSVAMNLPSSYTIAWSKEQHPEQLPILYAGVATSAVTILGAVLGDRYHGDRLMWAGLVASIGLFSYVTFFYKPTLTVLPGASP